MTNDATKQFRTYNHTDGDWYEHLKLITHNGNEQRETIIESTHRLGHTVSKLMQILPIIKQFFKQHDKDLFDEDEEKMNNLINDLFANMITIFNNEEDHKLFLNFLHNNIFALFIDRNDYNTLSNISNYLDLCNKYKAYCKVNILILVATKSHLQVDAARRIMWSKKGKHFAPDKILGHVELEKVFNEYNKNKDDYIFFNSYDFVSLSDICIASLTEIFNQGLIIKKCSSCGNFFVPMRSDALYCDESSPHSPHKTCKAYERYMSQLKAAQDNEAAKLFKQIYNMKNNRAMRSDNPIHTTEKENFVKEAREMRNDVKSGRCTQTDYIQWLNDTRKKKQL